MLEYVSESTFHCVTYRVLLFRFNSLSFLSLQDDSGQHSVHPLRGLDLHHLDASLPASGSAHGGVHPRLPGWLLVLLSRAGDRGDGLRQQLHFPADSVSV